MEVQMEHGLLGDVTGRGDEIHPLWREHGLDCVADLDARDGKVCDRSLVRVPEVGDVDPWNDKGVAPRRGSQREERHPALALADHLSLGIRAVDDAAERAVTPRA